MRNFIDSAVINNALQGVLAPATKSSVASINLDTFGNFASRQLQSVFQRQTTEALGGPLDQNQIRQAMQSVTSVAQTLGIDSPLVRDVINSISNITGIRLNGIPAEQTPTILMTTRVNGSVYSFKMFDSEDTLEFKDSINWSDTDIIGRSSPIFGYKNSSATEYTLNGTLTIDHPDEIKSWKTNMQNLRAMRFPVQFDLGLGSPPIWNLEILVPYTDKRVYGPVRVRVNSVSWQYLKPYLVDGVPAVTRITMDVREVEDPLEGSQVSYTSEILNIKQNQALSFNNKAVSRDVESTALFIGPNGLV